MDDAPNSKPESSSESGPGESATAPIKQMLARILDGEHLDRRASHALVGAIMDGSLTGVQVGAVLVALRMKGETADELIGAAAAMRERATAVQSELYPIVDTCGTGGDGSGSFNISTAAAVVAAACGATVAKHGNRAVSSQCGSADVLEALGVRIDLGPAEVARCLREVSIGFMYAPRFHPAMRHVGGARRELGVRTVFNLLGPLTNPAGAQRQVVGAFAADVAELLADALAGLGTEYAMVVHGDGGLDELTTSGRNLVFEVRDGSVRRFTFECEEAGLERRPQRVTGGDAATNAALMRQLFDGGDTTVADSVLLNAAATLVVAGVAPSLADGVDAARAALRSGACSDRLETWKRVSIAAAGDEALA